MIPDWYEVLQISPNAESEVIESAYKRLAFKYHPDRNPGRDCEERMKLINEAFVTLSDPSRRANYDRTRQHSGGPTGAGNSSTSQSQSNHDQDRPPGNSTGSPPAVPDFPWESFWRHPYTSHPSSFWVTLVTFGIVVPLILRWLLVRVEPGYLTSASALLASSLFLFLNRHAFGSLARSVVDRNRAFKLAAKASVAAAIFPIGISEVIAESIPGVPWSLKYWCFFHWGLLAALAVTTVLFINEVPSIGQWRQESAANKSWDTLPWPVLGITLTASVFGACLGPASAIQLREAGHQMLNAGKLDKAAQLFEESLHLSPGNEKASLGLAIAKKRDQTDAVVPTSGGKTDAVVPTSGGKPLPVPKPVDDRNFTDQEHATIRTMLTTYSDSIGKVLIGGTHPTGKFSSASLPSVSLSADRRDIEVKLTCFWNGTVNDYQTVFSFTINKQSGFARLRVEKDTAIFQIKPQNLLDTEASLREAIGPLR